MWRTRPIYRAYSASVNGCVSGNNVLVRVEQKNLAWGWLTCHKAGLEKSHHPRAKAQQIHDLQEQANKLQQEVKEALRALQGEIADATQKLAVAKN